MTDEFIDPWLPTHEGPGSLLEFHRGCRCDDCRAAKAARARELRDARMKQRVLINGRLVAPVDKHGSLSTYMNWGCRCVPCSDTNIDYHQKYRQRNI